MRGVYRLSRAQLEEMGTKDDLEILHPLPRVDEMDESLDGTDFAVYFHQARNGVPVERRYWRRLWELSNEKSGRFRH